MANKIVINIIIFIYVLEKYLYDKTNFIISNIIYWFSTYCNTNRSCLFINIKIYKLQVLLLEENNLIIAQRLLRMVDLFANGYAYWIRLRVSNNSVKVKNIQTMNQ